MHETRRFLIALGGVGLCLAIAGVVLVSGPEVVPPGVPPPARPFVLTSGPAAPPPAAIPWPARPARRPAVSKGPGAIVPHAGVPAAALLRPVAPAAAPVEVRPAPAALDASRLVLTVATAPEARGHAVEALAHVDAPPDHAGTHGPVTGAFLVAGKEVGRGFRTAGRAIKGLF